LVKLLLLEELYSPIKEIKREQARMEM